jgi:hypothetical protein
LKDFTLDQPLITCPHCHNEIKLTESLAAPLIASVKLEHEVEIRKKEELFQKREALLNEQQKALVEAKLSIDEQVNEKLKLHNWLNFMKF